MSYKTYADLLKDVNHNTISTTKKRGVKAGHFPNNPVLISGKNTISRGLDLLYRKHAKYVFINQFASYRARYYMRNGSPRYNRKYGIGVLTDSNHYHYIEFSIRTLHLSSHSFFTLRRLLFLPFLIDNKTEVILDKNIKESDIVGAAFLLVQTSGRFSIAHTDMETPYRRVDNFYKFFRYKQYGEKRKKKVFDKLYETGRLMCLPEGHKDKMDAAPKYKQQMMMDNIMGIIYMFAREETRRLNNESKQRRLERLAKEENQGDNNEIK